MATPSTSSAHPASKSAAAAPHPSPARTPAPDPAGQSPDAPIEFANTDVGRGNAERANAEPEPEGLHAAEVPGVPDVAAQRRRDAARRNDA